MNNMNYNSPMNEYSFKLEKLRISLTTRCNLNCIKCDIPKMKKVELDTNQIKNAIKDASKLGAKSISLTGGEPTVREDIFDIIRYASKKNMEVGMVTNGTLVDENFAIELAKSGLDHINVSLDGLKEKDEKIRGKGNFEKTVNAIKHLNGRISSISIETVILKENYLYLTDVLKLASNLNIKNISFQLFSDRFLIQKNKKRISNLEIKGNEIEKLKREIDKLIILSKLYGININDKYLQLVPDYLSKNLNFLLMKQNCLAPFRQFAISPNGDVKTCWAYDVIGNIHKDSLTKLCSSINLNKLLESVKNGNCPGCLLVCYQKFY